MPPQRSARPGPGRDGQPALHLVQAAEPKRRPVAEQEDEELIARAQQADPDAFDELVRRHQGVAYRTARLVVGAEDAKDVTQDAFVKAYRALGGFRPGAPFRPWLLAIVVNGARDHRRAAGRRSAMLTRWGARREVVVQPDELAVAAADRAALLAALRSLPERDQLVLHCRFLLDLSEAETAQILAVPAGTVKSRSARAMSRLRQRLIDGASQ